MSSITDLNYLKERKVWEKLEIPLNAFLIDNKIKPTAENLRAIFPQARRIFAVDFEVIFPAHSPAEWLLGPNGEVLGLINRELGIINIDHHSLHQSFDIANISTTHQSLIAMQIPELIPAEEDAIAVNHLDFDSVAPLFVLTNPKLSPLLKILFAHTAVDADHTGSGGLTELIALVDALYDKRDLGLTLKCVQQFLMDGSLENLPVEILAEYEAELRNRNLARELVERGDFVDVGAGVILLCLQNGEQIQTLTLPGIFQEKGINCSLVIIAVQKGAHCKLNVREGRDFPKSTTLQKLAQELNLARFGFGGRAHVGGNSRSATPGEPVTGIEFAELMANQIRKYS